MTPAQLIELDKSIAHALLLTRCMLDGLCPIELEEVEKDLLDAARAVAENGGELCALIIAGRIVAVGSPRARDFARRIVEAAHAAREHDDDCEPDEHNGCTASCPSLQREQAAEDEALSIAVAQARAVAGAGVVIVEPCTAEAHCACGHVLDSPRDELCRHCERRRRAH
jgi:hypothetical protein